MFHSRTHIDCRFSTGEKEDVGIRIDLENYMRAADVIGVVNMDPVIIRIFPKFDFQLTCTNITRSTYSETSVLLCLCLSFGPLKDTADAC